MTDFVASVPELRPAWDDHVRDNGEPLPHVFFGDVSRFAVEVARARDAVLAGRLAGALEQLAASPEADVENVIHVSFVEYFVWGGEEEQVMFEWLKPFFGPAMLARIQEFEAYSEELRDAAAKLPPEDLST